MMNTTIQAIRRAVQHPLVRAIAIEVGLAVLTAVQSQLRGQK